MIEERYIKTLELDKVLGLLADEAACDDTKEAIAALRPSIDYIDVKTMMKQTEDGYKMVMRYGRPPIFAVKNMTAALKRAASGGVLTPLELLRIAEVLRNIRSLISWRNQSEVKEDSLTDLFASMITNRMIENEIADAIVSEDEIDDNASPALHSIRRKIVNAQQSTRSHLDNLIHSATLSKFLQDSIVTMRDGRYVVPVKAEYRGEIKGLVHDTSSSGATVFIEPIGVVEANNEIRILRHKEQEEIERILRELSSHVGEYADAIVGSYRVLIELDLIFAKANYGAKTRAIIPHITADGVTHLYKARHPLIDEKRVVPITISLGDEFDTLVITGPNTGGKTVSIKTLGLLTLMGMCGMMIPAGDNSSISVCTDVLVDIGDEQSIEQSLSTFSGHMTNIVHILEQAHRGSLVIIDELGAGTDPTEGAALAVAILDTLREKGCRTLATTHYAEIKIYAIETERVENACCEFNVDTLCPTYKLLVGVPGRSNAFAISKRLGLDENIIDRAKRSLDGEKTRFEDVISSLEASRTEFERQSAELELLKRQLREEKEKTEKLNRSIEDDQKKEMDAARQKAKQMVDDVRVMQNQLLNEIDELRRQKETADIKTLAQRAKAELKGKFRRMEDRADPIAELRNADYKLPRALKVGDTVTLADIGKDATVLALPDSSGQVEVLAGIIKTRVPIENLRLVEKKKQQQKGGRNAQGGSVSIKKDTFSREASLEVDLRGMNSEEAIMTLDQSIDHAVMMNQPTLTIIHGKGTGVLRAAVQQHLKRHPSIKSYRLGVYGEGEAGVTIAEIK